MSLQLFKISAKGKHLVIFIFTTTDNASLKDRINYITFKYKMFQIGFLFAFLIPAILFVLTQYRTLRIISPENREMSPGSVWLQVIPVFGLVWQFFVVIRIAHSISKEMASNIGESILDNSQVQIKESDEPSTYTIGLAYCTLTTLGGIINYSIGHISSYLKLFGPLFVLTGMVCWIIYWVRLAMAKNKLFGLSVGFAR